MNQVTIRTRELTPFEHLVAQHLCDGLSNAAIAATTSHSEKVVENTVSRMGKALGVKSAPEINTRVLIALAYRAHFGDNAFDKLGIACQHLEILADGTQICSHHTE